MEDARAVRMPQEQLPASTGRTLGERAGNSALNAGAWRTVASEPFVLVIADRPQGRPTSQQLGAPKLSTSRLGGATIGHGSL